MKELEKEEKIRTLLLMDNTASKVNDEEVYEYWLMFGIPDGSILDDFVDYAEDYEEFEEAFIKLMRMARKNGGLFNATDEEYKLAKRYEPTIENIIYK